MSELKTTIISTLGVIANQEQSKLLSKVCGRENYIIYLRDNKVIYYGTKGKWYCPSVPLKEAYKYQTLRYTYKKDWLAALDILGVQY